MQATCISIPSFSCSLESRIAISFFAPCRTFSFLCLCHISFVLHRHHVGLQAQRGCHVSKRDSSSSVSVAIQHLIFLLIFIYFPQHILISEFISVQLILSILLHAIHISKASIVFVCHVCHLPRLSCTVQSAALKIDQNKLCDAFSIKLRNDLTSLRVCK